MIEEEKDDVRDYVNEALDEVHGIFEKKIENRYFEGCILQSAIIEELLRFLIQFKTIWTTDLVGLSSKKSKELEDFFHNRMNFYSLIKTSYLLKLINEETYGKLESYRNKRNKIVHDCLYHKMNNKEAFNFLKNGSKISDSILKKLNYYTKKAGI